MLSYYWLQSLSLNLQSLSIGILTPYPKKQADTLMISVNDVILIIEPISGTAPKVPLMLKNVHYNTALSTTVSLLCPAQSYPVSNFRFVYIHNLFVTPYSYQSGTLSIIS